ncbi:hypothetical protein LK994_01765 [Ferruginibacter lapsinanis]|uniref:hypothetical protein n=1 Tax=Ferruginibacter lapsinanis TaxID=563172 RepID=UPI001E37D94A|nr:hypothetical protein [Ferruginibacter lapsinanis]UEG50200.1 hypothetical protein LK994_01765 [Ferruginibacter lapsinanis]
MKKNQFIILSVLLLLSTVSFAQKDTIPFFKGALKENRDKHYKNLINNTITKNLELPLADSTEANWEDAFWAMELTLYRSPLLTPRIRLALDSAKVRSYEFQRSLLEMVYALYPKEFTKEVSGLITSDSAKIFAMAAEYLLRAGYNKAEIIKAVTSRSKAQPNDPIIKSLLNTIQPVSQKLSKQMLADLLSKKFLPGNVIVYSLQRKNRNYPGITIIRDKAGNFYKTGVSNIFYVSQLTRSISNLPGYLTKGNTPQGIFRMFGFDVSRAAYIGPTKNIQLTMPGEASLQHFLKDSTITDSIWTENYYKKLLPASCKKYVPLSQSYYAGMAGRNEIIAHGTTVNPEYYKGQPYYPYTPTEGCLCTKEIWSEGTGRLTVSDQQKLVDAVQAAGGPDGYCVVIELDDQQKPVSINEILPLLKPAK